MTRLRRSEDRFDRPGDVHDRAVVTVFRVPPESAGQRVDVFMRGQLHRTSRTRTQEIVRASAYDGAGRRLKPNDRVRAEQHILLWREPWDETPVPTEIPVLYEDEHMLAVDKPANLPVHPTARYHHNTLIKLLQAERPGEWLSLAHRIDRETSGVLIVSKTPAFDKAMKQKLEARDGVEKTYLAITHGLPIPKAATSGGESSFRYQRSMELDLASRYKVKMRVSDGPTALYAATRFHVQATRWSPAREDTGARSYALVRCELETGRQHQIRVHLADLGAPIVGDKLYGHDESAFARAADGELTEEDLSLLELPRHALHAHKLELSHPVTGQPLAIESPLPGDMKDFWEALREAPRDHIPRGTLSRST